MELLPSSAEAESRPEADEEPVVTTEAPRRASHRGLWQPAAIFIVSRVIVFTTFSVVASRRHYQLKKILLLWDGGFYRGIAGQGYPTYVAPKGTSKLAFFPVFPLIVRGVTKLTHADELNVLIFVTFVAGLAATCLLWILTRELRDAATANRAAALFSFAPGSFALTLYYAEGVLIACAIAACLSLLHRRYVLAGVFAGIASATRPNGLALVLSAAWVAFFAWRDHRQWRPVIAVPLAAGGFVAVQLYFWQHTGVADAWFRAERNGWNEKFSLTGRVADVKSAAGWMLLHHSADWNRIAAAAGLFAFVLMLVLLVRYKLPGELIMFAVGVGVFALTSKTLGFRPRFVLTAFPLVIGLAIWLRNRIAFAAVLLTSSVLLVVTTWVTVSGNKLVP